MSEECKNFEKRAKESEKDDPMKSMELYRQAANCYNINDKPKDYTSNMEKAAKIARSHAKEIENPDEAMEIFTKSSEIYIEIGKSSESEKIIQEGYQKFEQAVKSLRSEVKGIENPVLAEEKLSMASDYAVKAKNEPLSRECWAELAEKYRESANKEEDPREALDLFKKAIINYKKGGTDEREYPTLGEAAEKFNTKAAGILKTDKQLILAVDNYLQAGKLYEAAKKDEKATEAEIQVQEICDTIGLPIEYVSQYLESQGYEPISLT